MVVDETVGDRIPVGIIADRDIVIEVLGKGLDPAKTAVASVMSSQLVVADSCEDVSEAVERMRAHGVRRIPVTGDGGTLLGIFTLDDLLKLNAEQVDAIGNGRSCNAFLPASAHCAPLGSCIHVLLLRTCRRDSLRHPLAQPHA